MCLILCPFWDKVSTSRSHCVDFPALSKPSNTMSFPRAILCGCSSNELREIDGRGLIKVDAFLHVNVSRCGEVDAFSDLMP